MRIKFLILLTLLVPLTLFGDAASKIVMQKLQSGNKRFLKSEEFLDHKEGQSPFVTLLSCSDSRVSPELIFDQNLGQIFNIRTAGNVIDTIGLETIEFGVLQLKTPLIVVLGHTKCGAVEAAIDAYQKDPNGKHMQLIDKILPAVKKASSMSKSDLWDAAVKQNVLDMANKILEMSPKIRAEVKSGKVEIVKGVYNLETGTIQWLDK